MITILDFLIFIITSDICYNSEPPLEAKPVHHYTLRVRRAGPRWAAESIEAKPGAAALEPCRWRMSFSSRTNKCERMC